MVKKSFSFSKSDNNIIGLVAFVLDSEGTSTRIYFVHNTSGQIQECKSNNHHILPEVKKMSDAIARRKFLEAPISDNSFPPLVNQCANMASLE